MSNSSSSLLVLPHPAKKMTRRVITQNAVITRSMTFHKDVQNCYGNIISIQVKEPPNSLRTLPKATKRIATSRIMAPLMTSSRI